MNESATLTDVAGGRPVEPIEPKEGCDAGVQLSTASVERGVPADQALQGATHDWPILVGFLVTRHSDSPPAASPTREPAAYLAVPNARPPRRPENTAVQLRKARCANAHAAR